MPGLGSVTEGMIGTQLDLQKIQMNQVDLQRDQIGLQQDKINLQKQMTFLNLLRNTQVGQASGTGPSQSNAVGPDDMSSWLNQMATMQLQSGMPDEAAKTARAASTLQENASKIDYRTFRMQNDRLNKFANVLSTVEDSPQGYTQAIQTMMAEDPGVARDPKFQALSKMAWRPGLVGQLRNQVLSEKDRQEINYRAAAERHADAAAVLDSARVDLVKAQTKVAQDRDIALKKAGAVTVKAEQLRAITDQATRDFPSADPADIRVRSRPLAEEAVRMMKDQHITLSEAATRVYESARTSGTFSGLREPPTMPGSKPGAALPLPKNPKQAQQNQWYLVGGVPRLLMGTKLYTEKELDEIDKEDEAESDREDQEDEDAN